jgi:hypothetical protein
VVQADNSALQSKVRDLVARLGAQQPPSVHDAVVAAAIDAAPRNTAQRLADCQAECARLMTERSELRGEVERLRALTGEVET